MRIVRTFMLFVLLALPCRAWGEQGHRVVGQIAYDNLTPAVRARVDRLLEVGLPTLGRRFETLAVACTWPDVVRSGGRLEPYNHPIWHYSSLPFLDGVPSSGQVAQGELVPALGQQLAILADGRRTRHERMIALAWVGHLAGDIHQPLHATSRFSPELPRGDRGGNLFPILGPEYVDHTGSRVPIDNLHTYWDQGAGQFLEPIAPEQIVLLARELEQAYPPSSFGPNLGDLRVESWRSESFKLAVGTAYPGIAPGTAPSENYRSFSQRVCRRRMAAAGYRLAAVLNAALR